MTTDNAILLPLRDALVETLGVDNDEVTPPANFFSDLGGESIDLLDLTFRLEHLYPVKMNFGELSGLWKQDDDGRLTAESVNSLRRRWPILREEELAAIASDGNWHQLLSVDLINRLLQFRLQAAEAGGDVAKAS